MFLLFLRKADLPDELKSDSEKFVLVFPRILRYKGGGGNPFYSQANLIEWIAFQSVPAFQIAHGDMFRA